MEPPLEFGLMLAATVRGLAVTTYPEMQTVARRAEDLGFDSIWLCDHFLTLPAQAYTRQAGIDRTDRTIGTPEDRQSMPLLECWTTLSALARDTRRLRLGTSVLCHSYRHPPVLAKMAATLDVISEGRLDLGLGAGWFEQEYRAYGIPFPKASVRIEQLGEAVELIRRIWTEPYPTFHFRHYQIDGAICDPRPQQRPHPPIWIGGEGEKVHRVAARGADGLNVRWWPPQQFVARRPLIEAACREFGRDPATLRLSILTLLLVGQDRRVLAAERARFGGIPETGVIAGTPSECVARIRQYVDVGVRHFLFAIPDIAQLDMLELAGTEVLPAVREAVASA